MKTVFLESHNIKNKYSGFGQFNYHLIKGLASVKPTELDIVLHAKDTEALALSQYCAFIIFYLLFRL